MGKNPSRVKKMLEPSWSALIFHIEFRDIDKLLDGKRDAISETVVSSYK